LPQGARHGPAPPLVLGAGLARSLPAGRPCFPGALQTRRNRASADGPAGRDRRAGPGPLLGRGGIPVGPVPPAGTGAAPPNARSPKTRNGPGGTAGPTRPTRTTVKEGR